MSLNPNSEPEGSGKYSYPRKVIELGKSHISTSTFKKVVETELDPDVKEKGLQGVDSSKDQVNDLAKALRPGTYFRDKPPIATTSNIRGLHIDIAERRDDYQSESNLAKVRSEALLKAQNRQQSNYASHQQPVSPPPQRPVDQHIIDYKNTRFSSDVVNPAVTPTLVQTAVERPPSEAISLTQIPRAPSIDQEPAAPSLPFPPRAFKRPAFGAQMTGIKDVSAISGQKQDVMDSKITKAHEHTVASTGSTTPTASLDAGAQSSASTPTGQVSRKGKHRRGNIAQVADNAGTEQLATGTFGQPQDFRKAGIKLGENFVVEKDE
ncbi:hypothetical protein HYPSUDRAFT_37556 [Hypholoma sublateritium FD-334 SS-4]|uniref:Uncharacterized protein n=1 Tax=Hypholoma sublateritium (strain FD-334 SS-4) TaxID=945553 RepID=A0A0D2LDR1_HYPSF|nr:hypothetical protein HYPSUDRAFT_37556 [Hypholoma sublateritium FD-334 SS-4]